MLRLYKTKLQKRLLWVMFLSIIVALFLLLIPVCADDENNGIWEFFGYDADRMKTLRKILTGQNIHETLNQCFDTSSNGLIDTIFNLGIVQSLLTITKIVGMGLVLIHAGFAIHTLSKEDRLTEHSVSNICITIAVPSVIIINMDIVAKGMQTVCIWIRDIFLNATLYGSKDASNMGTVNDAVDSLTQTITENGGTGHIADVGSPTLNTIIVWIIFIIFIFMDIIIRIGLMIACFGVIGRLLLLQMFLPLGIADLGEDGFKGNGVSLLKQYLATCLEIPVFYFLASIGWCIFALLVTTSDSPGTLVWFLICLITVGTGLHTLMSGANGMMREITNAK